MNKQTILSLLRSILQLVGSYLIGRNLFGHSLDENLLQTFGESVVVLGAAIWGVLDKSVGIEQLQSALRSTVTIVTSLLASWGIISGQSAIAIVGFSTALVPVLQSYVSKVKVQQQDQGKLVADRDPKKAGTLVKASPKGFSSIIILLICLSALSGHAQSFFKPVEKPHKMVSARSLQFEDAPLVNPTTMTAFRPVLNAVTYSEPDHIAMAGVGVSYQWLKYNATTQKWETTFAINALFYGGAGLTSPNQGIYATGPSISFLNGFLTIGGAYNFVTKKIGPTLGINVQLNN